MSWILSQGTLRYTGNWLFLDIEEELTKYYRHLFYLHSFKTIKLNPPTFSHVSVITKYDIKNEKWGDKFLDGHDVYFDYSNNIQGCELYNWLTVKSKVLQSIRKYYGLGKPFYPFHISIGNLK